MQLHITRSADGIITCLLDNPQQRNALTADMLQRLCETFEAAQHDPTVRAVVLRGENGTFCAGRDLRELDAGQDHNETDMSARIAPVSRLADAMRQCDVPTLAVVQGKAIGLGVALCCWCDVVLATEDAVFKIPEARAGIVPTFTAVSLASIIGSRQALALCTDGRTLSANEARALGLVHDTCDPAALDTRVQAQCSAWLDNGPQALRLCKSLLRRTASRPFDSALNEAASLSVASMHSPEAQQGMQALREKRQPPWASARSS